MRNDLFYMFLTTQNALFYKFRDIRMPYFTYFKVFRMPYFTKHFIFNVAVCLIREKVVTFRMVKLNMLLSIFLITK